jgi:hypothetical protein
MLKLKKEVKEVKTNAEVKEGGKGVKDKWPSMKSLCLWGKIHSKAIVFNSFNSLNSFNSKISEY